MSAAAHARPWLVIAAGLSFAASLFHIACMVGGPDWFRFAGAGEAMARTVERGAVMPYVLTTGVAVILAGWGAYALSAAGIGPRLPLVRTALLLIVLVLSARAALAFVPAAWAPEQGAAFIAVTSAICLVLGACFAVGLWRAWPFLSTRVQS